MSDWRHDHSEMQRLRRHLHRPERIQVPKRRLSWWRLGLWMLALLLGTSVLRYTYLLASG